MTKNNTSLTQKLRRKLFEDPLPTYWWRYHPPEKVNFGDELTPYILKGLFGCKVRHAPPETCKLIGVGSIIEIVQEAKPLESVDVWGSGFIQPGPANKISNIYFHAVRGKLSLKRVDNKQAALGDPALLMPLIFTPRRTKLYKLGIVPHYVDKEAPEVAALAKSDGVKIINVFDSPERVVEDINSCELIISSSLHGLIISDAYGVPNYWHRFSSKLKGGEYKFNDYYSVFNEVAENHKIDSLESLPIKKLIQDYTPRPEQITEIQKSLIASFPY